MRFLVDECCDADMVDALRGDGHDVLYATESLRGATDDELLTCAVSEGQPVPSQLAQVVAGRSLSSSTRRSTRTISTAIPCSPPTSA